MGRDDEREAELALERVDQIEHALAGVGVEVAGWLVAQQQLGPLRERTSDRDALRLAAGELDGQAVRLASEADELEQLAGLEWRASPGQGARRTRRSRTR